MAYYVPVSLNKTLTGWPAGTTRYYAYASGSCQAASAAFSALSDAQKLAATVATVPTPAAGTHWSARNCGSSSSGTYSITGPDYIA